MNKHLSLTNITILLIFICAGLIAFVKAYDQTQNNIHEADSPSLAKPQSKPIIQEEAKKAEPLKAQKYINNLFGYSYEYNDKWANDVKEAELNDRDIEYSILMLKDQSNGNMITFIGINPYTQDTHCEIEQKYVEQKDSFKMGTRILNNADNLKLNSYTLKSGDVAIEHDFLLHNKVCIDVSMQYPTDHSNDALMQEIFSTLRFF